MICIFLGGCLSDTSPPPQVLPLHGMMMHVHHRFKDDGIHHRNEEDVLIYEHAYDYTGFWLYVLDKT
jgi:hypothetical protein